MYLFFVKITTELTALLHNMLALCIICTSMYYCTIQRGSTRGNLDLVRATGSGRKFRLSARAKVQCNLDLVCATGGREEL